MASRDKFDREYRAIIAMLQRHRKAAGMTHGTWPARCEPINRRFPSSNAANAGLDIVDYLRICRVIGLDPGKPLRKS